MVSAVHLNNFSPNYLSFFEAPVKIKNLAIMARVCIKISEVLTISLPKLLFFLNKKKKELLGLEPAGNEEEMKGTDGIAGI